METKSKKKLIELIIIFLLIIACISIIITTILLGCNLSNQVDLIKTLNDTNIDASAELTLLKAQALAFIIIACFEALIMIAGAIILWQKYLQKKNNYSKLTKTKFLSQISHDIRTPMNAIIGFCRMASDSNSIEDIKTYLRHIGDSSSYLLQLINSIFDISKIETGKMVLDVDAYSLNDIMDDIYNMLSSPAHNKNIDFKVIKDSAIPSYIYCDKMYLTQVIVNFITNSLKFTPANGYIYVEVKVLAMQLNDCHLQFAISDNGTGIEEENIEHIFDIFAQGYNTTTSKFEGTGLGLNVSKLLIEMMGGTVRVESQIGNGSTFTFDAWFKLVNEEDMKKIYTSDSDIHHLDLSGKTVLLVEDNEINQIIATNALESFNAKVEYANNGREGVEAFTNNPDKYYLIIMDIQMPEMDGYEATRKIRHSGVTNATTIPIIAMSAYVFKEDIENSLKSGMNAHIAKPFEIKQLMDTIINVTTKD